MRHGKVFVEDSFAGIISETSSGFTFEYDTAYLGSENALPVSITLPLRQEAYESKTLFSFFDGLIPEGWLLNDTEELAITLQGFKKKLMSFDFIHAMEDTGVDRTVAERIVGRFQKYRKTWIDCIDVSFITEEQKRNYKMLITSRLDALLK